MTTTIKSFELEYSDLFRNCFQFTKLFRYCPNFPFHIETENYIVKTAGKLKELYLIFKLRQEAFLLNDQNCRIPFLIDIDEHDFNCDHIVIIDKKSSRICGTYRMQTSLTTKRFYSEEEFDLNHFLAEPGVKLELGRACIHPDFRNGAIIDLLWRGIAKYMQLTGSRYLFGCSSVRLTDAKSVGELNAYLKSQSWLNTKYQISPTQDFRMDGLIDQPFSDESKKLLPSLLRSYIQAGALVHGDPALDLDFDCIDYLTILDIKKITPSFARRYFPFN
jgi:putative hemolysin